ncbi:methyl-accepting chemotaxis protein [Shewanella algae]|uniref:methyl-accepting chemotaxis protein n=1 Tax=Shewanella algae TaxID=38313 RepID=UPI001AACB038|nr:methyl-accepting chemotaxis protein [Shewanella algae]MBO2655102.1 methyl-accepting chemotaxis protein [Shewanella algae]
MKKIVMWFSNLSIGTKLYGSFSILLLFMLTLVYFSFSAQVKISERIDKADEANEIVERVLFMRTMEQKYNLSHSAEYVESVDLSVSKITSYSRVLYKKLREESERESIEVLEKQVDGYNKSFKNFVSVAVASDETYKQLKSYGIKADALLRGVQSEFRKQTVTFLHSNSDAIVPKVDGLISQIESSNRMVNWILETQLAEMKYFMTGDLAVKNKLPDAVDKIKDSLSSLSHLLPHEKIIDIGRVLDEYALLYSKLLSLEHNEQMLTQEMKKYADNAMKIAQRVQDVQKSKLLEVKRETIVKSLSLGFFAFFFSVFSAWFIIRIVVPPIQRAKTLAKEIADGYLIERDALGVQYKDEVGQLMSALETMVVKLRVVVTDIAGNSRRILCSSENLLDVTDTAKEGIARQDKEVDEVVASLEQMSSAIQQIVNNAKRAEVEAKEAQGASTEGQVLVSQSRETISNLMREIAETADDVEAVKDEVISVSGIIDVIDEVATQTNLLALNAAIEAARAGEQGRGFAVVSEEIRNLSIRTQESTERVRLLIRVLQEKSSEAVIKIKSNKAQAELAMAKGDEVVESFKYITQTVDTVLDMNARIASVSTEQSVAANRITLGIRTVKKVSEQVTAMAKKSAVASHELAGLSKGLELLVSKFKI